MNQRDLASTVLRLYAFYLLLYCLRVVTQLGLSGIFAVGVDRPESRMLAYSQGAYLLIQLFVAAFLLARTGTVVRWVLPKAVDHDGMVHLPPQELTILAFSLAGLFFLMSGLETVVAEAARYYLSPKDQVTAIHGIFRFDAPHLIAAAFKTGLGLWLFLGSPYFVELVRRARDQQGLPEGTDSEQGDA